jgi:proteasome lid subunit RPN8/RPN11
MKDVYIYTSVLRRILAFVCNHLDPSSSNLGVEVSGLLIGREKGDKIIIHDFLTGDQKSTPLYTSLSEEFLAKTATMAAMGEINGRIYGWFHSHIGIGLFLSSIDVKTLKNMQRLCPYCFAMVVDPLTSERFRLFRYDFEEDRPYSIEMKRIRG